MKRIFFLCSLLLVAGLTASAQSRYVMPEGMVDTADGMAYNLPQSPLAIDLVVEKEEVKAGPYARYALKCLGLRAPFSDKTSWRIVGADIALLAQEELVAKGLPLPTEQVGDLASMLPMDRIDLLQPTEEEAAMQAAKRIFQLRRTRLELISGEVGEHVFGEGLKSALEEINRQEQALLSLFFGTKTKRVETCRLTLIPEGNKKQYILCRFSEQEGLLPSTDLSGEIVMLDITPQSPYSVEEAPVKSTTIVPCRVAAPCNCSVQTAGRELVQRTLPLFEYGHTVQVLLPRKR